MKNILAILFLLALSGCVKQQEYCGTVTELFRTDAGYKSSPEAHVVFYCPKLGRKVDVEVTWNDYANKFIGQKVCYKLDDNQLKH